MTRLISYNQHTKPQLPKRGGAAHTLHVQRVEELITGLRGNADPVENAKSCQQAHSKSASRSRSYKYSSVDTQLSFSAG